MSHMVSSLTFYIIIELMGGWQLFVTGLHHHKILHMPLFLVPTVYCGSDYLPRPIFIVTA